MDDWVQVLLLTLMAGLAMPIGAVLARIEKIRTKWVEEEFRHSVMAFGGGALLSAIALVLVPEGSKELNVVAVSMLFLAGGLTFMFLDILLDKFKSPAGQLVAMLSDFVPEALALGAAFAVDGSAGLLLAALIAIQNLPEGFNSYHELSESGGGISPGKIVAAFFVLALLGPVAGLAGFFWLASYPMLVGAIMIFAAGGILYLVFQDIAPQAKLEKHWLPAMGAVLGFLLGLIGQMLVQG